MDTIRLSTLPVEIRACVLPMSYVPAILFEITDCDVKTPPPENAGRGQA